MNAPTQTSMIAATTNSYTVEVAQTRHGWYARIQGSPGIRNLTYREAAIERGEALAERLRARGYDVTIQIEEEAR